MSQPPAFEQLMADMRPRLHRYCARMTGSAIDGEDVVQDTFIKALSSPGGTTAVANTEAWLFRIAHNASVDFLRRRARDLTVEYCEDMDIASVEADPGLASAGFRTFLELPVLQRCAVVLKDVLGHSVEEIADIAGCTPAAAKSALQRGRQRLAKLATAEPAAPVLPSLEDRQRLETFVGAFRTGDFDAIRAMLADDVRVNLVNRLTLKGRTDAAPYFSRYAERLTWRYAAGTVDGRAVMLVFDAAAMEHPAHFAVPEWRNGQITAIQDFLFAPYAMDGCAWAALA